MAVLDQRALGRATLDRQMLLRRASMPARDAIEHLVGMQAQAPIPPYFGLWTRLVDFHPDQLVRLIQDRDAVRIAAMRSTVHLLSARDALALRPLVQPVLERMLKSSVYGRAIAGLDRVELVTAAREVLAEAAKTGKQLGTALGERWPGVDGTALANAIRVYLPLVQVPPRGIWGASGQATLTPIESWLGRGVEAVPSAESMVLRYLGAFGPASIADIQAWSGLTKLSEIVGRLRPRLVTFRSQAGAELFDLPDAPRPDPDTPAPVRFIPEYDNLTLSYADRTRVLSELDRRRTYGVNGVIPGMVLIDGTVAALWKLRRDRSSATLIVTPLREVPTSAMDDLAEEGLRLLRFAAPDGTYDIVVTSVFG